MTRARAARWTEIRAWTPESGPLSPASPLSPRRLSRVKRRRRRTPRRGAAPRRATRSGAGPGLAAGRHAQYARLGDLARAHRVGDLLADEPGRGDRDRDLRPHRDLLLGERLAQVEHRASARCREALALVRAALLLLGLLLGLARH